MLQNELKLQLAKTQLQNKILFIITGILFLSIVSFGVLFFTNNNNQTINSSEYSSPSDIKKVSTLQVKHIQIDTTQININNLSKLQLISKFDSMAYIIETLQLKLSKAEIKSERDYKRYKIASEYEPPTKIIVENKAQPTPKKENTQILTKKVQKQDNVNNLIETAKKYAETDCKKALEILYSTKKIAQIEGTLKANNSTINKMMQDCLKQLGVY